MKKVISFLLVAVICCSLCACGGADPEAIALAETIYENTNIAYEITEQLSNDVYEAWKLAVSDDDKISVSYLSSKLGLDVDAIDEGVVYAIFRLSSDANYDTASEADKEVFRGEGEFFFKMMEDDLCTACVLVTIGAYKATGKIKEADAALEAADEQLQELQENYSDYEYYPALDGYYTTTVSFFDLCLAPSGSLAQFVEEIDAYRSEAQTYIGELDS